MAALFVDQLTVIDFAYFDPKRGIVGESWIVDIVLEGDLDDQGMVFDFGDVKKQIKIAIDGSVDHKFVVPKRYHKLNSQLEENNLLLEIQDEQDRWYRHQSPSEAVVLLESDNVTMDAVKTLLIEECRQVVPDNVTHIELTLSTENITGAYYHYAHGLKKHLGDCQRIAHGHRSQIQIFADDVRSESLESLWAKKWQDIYIATQEDLVKELQIDDEDYYHFEYQSEQGHFALTLPKADCHLMQNDTTVELIANHIAKQIKLVEPEKAISIKAFEGVNKGAMASA
ncbi:6-carboxytetrahydropterin synthase [Kangiella sp. TOML190]|uniref:6-pyruvoyl trahydropterin synthase family protein n=1 Tax=Kangiella sp. TOML190 TaxID=2931351 RepID=UPI00203A7D7B|nr:6-carboxytetrahydropterin synthase [Kangiella sp. TOML190]